MPHARFSAPAALTTSSLTFGPRRLVPGIEPGGSRAGGATKPAMLITGLSFELVRWQPDPTVENKNVRIFLSLSQVQSQIPDFLLLLGTLSAEVQDATGSNAPVWIPSDYAVGTVWAPRFVGARFTLLGGFDAFQGAVHLDYEEIEVPWMDWFIMWEFLDNVVNDELEF